MILFCLPGCYCHSELAVWLPFCVSALVIWAKVICLGLFFPVVEDRVEGKNAGSRVFLNIEAVVHLVLFGGRGDLVGLVEKEVGCNEVIYV